MRAGNPKISVASNLKLAYALFLAPLAFLFYVMVGDAISDNAVTRAEIVGSDFVVALQKVENQLTIPGGAIPDTIVAEIEDAQHRFGAPLETATAAEQATSAIQQAKIMAEARTAVHELILTVADKSGLTLDSELGSYYVQNIMTVEVPALVDGFAALAETVAKDAGEADLTATEQAEVLTQIGALKARTAALQKFVSSFENDSTPNAPLPALSFTVKETIGTLNAAAENLNGMGIDSARADPDDATRFLNPVLSSLSILSDQSAATLHQLLQERIRIELRDMWSDIAIAVALFLAGVAFVLYRVELGAIIPLRRLTGNLKRLAEGDAGVSVEGTNRSDEIGELARAAHAFKQSLEQNRDLEAKLHRSRENLVHAQRIGLIGSADVDFKSGNAVWSEGMLQIYGLDVATIPKDYQGYLSLVHPDDVEIERTNRKRIERGEQAPPLEYRIVRSDGEVRWIHIENELRRDTQGVPASLFTIHQDITDRRRMEEEMRRDLASLVAVVAALNIARNAVILLDDVYKITYANDVAFEMLGLPFGPDALIGRRLTALQAAYPKFLEVAARSRASVEATGKWQGLVPWRRLTDGRTLTLDHHAHRLPNGGFVLVSTDATERLRLEEEDRRHREREAQASKIEALGNLAGGIAHDFNNLLGAVLGFGQFLLQDLQPGTDQHSFAQRIVAASERGRSLVRQILTFSRRTAIEATEVRPREIFAEAHEMLRATLPSTTQFVFENAVQDATVFMDKGQMLQVLVNLCVNASDALNEMPGTVTISVSKPDVGRPDFRRLPVADGRPDLAAVEIWTDPDGTGHLVTGGMPKDASVCISVADTGSGIPNPMLAKILEPFVTTKDKGKGTGLGLAVIHRIVIDHGGAMAVTTREASGTRFDIVLPLASRENHGSTVVQFPAAEDVVVAPGTAANILVVDDDEAYLAMVETALQRVGHRVQSTRDPRTALDWFKSDGVKWDVLVTDQTMPHIRGNDLIRQVKTLAPHTICILCTGFSSGLSEHQAVTAGSDAFLLKPYSVGDLANLVSRLRERDRHAADTQNAPI